MRVWVGVAWRGCGRGLHIGHDAGVGSELGSVEVERLWI